ncbi:MAG: hypothetical protein NXH88_17965 [Hyphomonas sp.]|nr:hypothetical protein [Hyphomonas sp.]
MKISSIVIATGFCLTAPAWAQENVSTESIYACASIETDAERLACYDAAVTQFRAAEEAGEVATISKSEIAELNRESFGFSLPSLPKNILPKFGSSDESDIDVLTEPVKSVSRTRLDKLRVTLENGQIWEQIDTKQVYYSKKRGVESAEINRAALGSFKMKLDGGRAFRAKRIR